MNRRSFVQQAAALGLAAAALPLASWASPATEQDVFGLPQLPYAYDALAPHIDAETMRIHHSKHHAAYVDKLNQVLAAHPALRAKSLVELLQGLNQLPETAQTTVRNHGGGHYNHSLFWQCLHPKPAAPDGPLLAQLNAHFGSLDAFKKQFAQAAATVFGSGWVWLLLQPNGKLAISTTPNQDNPLMPHASVHGTPLLALDVWEHAYYLHYQNRRADYVTAFWQVVHWPQVELNWQQANAAPKQR